MNVTSQSLDGADPATRGDRPGSRLLRNRMTAQGWKRGLTRKYVAVLMALVAVVLVASATVQVAFSYGDSKRAIFDLESTTAQSAAAQTTQFLTEIRTQMGWVVQPAATAATVTTEQRRARFNQLLFQEPAITELSYYDASGEEQLRISRLVPDSVASGRSFASAAKFTQARNGRTYLGPVYFPNGSEPYLTVSIGDGGQTSGVTSAEVNLKFVKDTVSQIVVGRAGFAYVVDRTGHLIAHPDINLVLRNTDMSSLPQVEAALKDQAGPAENEPRRSSQSRVAAMVSSDLDGSHVLTAWSGIDQPGWIVFVQQPLGEAFAPLYASVARTATLLLFGLAAAVVASWLLARGLVRPIRELQGGAAVVGSGDLNHVIRVDTGDELEELAGAFNDMTGRLRESYATLEQKVEDRTRELRKTSEQLEIASRLKSDFLASMSHELRTPLNAIIGFSEVLLDPELNQLPEEQQKQFQENIHRSGRHLLGLINDILDLSKVEAGRMELRRETVHLGELIGGCLAIVQPLASKKHITLDADNLTADLTIAVDPARVKQILYNLLSNAVKFTPEHGRVTVVAEASGPEVRIAVRDTGVGIKPEDQALVFEEFRQIDQGAARQEEGTGLGLALVRRLVELHGGRVWLESTAGKGSCFTFTLPLVPGGDQPIQPTPSEATLHSEETGGKPRDSKRLPILVVEDQREAAELLTLHLTRADYEVYRAATGDEALKVARQIQPYAITLDIMLPGSDGWEFLRSVRADPQLADVAVIVVSIVDNRELGFALGATDYLVKPIDNSSLLAILERLNHRKSGAMPTSGEEVAIASA